MEAVSNKAVFHNNVLSCCDRKSTVVTEFTIAMTAVLLSQQAQYWGLATGTPELNAVINKLCFSCYNFKVSMQPLKSAKFHNRQ